MDAGREVGRVGVGEGEGGRGGMLGTEQQGLHKSGDWQARTAKQWRPRRGH